jgi:hypothetical protein
MDREIALRDAFILALSQRIADLEENLDSTLGVQIQIKGKFISIFAGTNYNLQITKCTIICSTMATTNDNATKEKIKNFSQAMSDIGENIVSMCMEITCNIGCRLSLYATAGYQGAVEMRQSKYTSNSPCFDIPLRGQDALDKINEIRQQVSYNVLHTDKLLTRGLLDKILEG